MDIQSRMGQLCEVKVIRRVRTYAGVRRYKQPIGSIIIRDSVLAGLKLTATVDGYDRIESMDGKQKFWVGPGENGKWSVTRDVGDDEWGDEVLSADDEEEALIRLAEFVNPEAFQSAQRLGPAPKYDRPGANTRAEISDEIASWGNSLADNSNDRSFGSRLWELSDLYDADQIDERGVLVRLNDIKDEMESAGENDTLDDVKYAINSVRSLSKVPKRESIAEMREKARQFEANVAANAGKPRNVKLNDITEGTWIRVPDRVGPNGPTSGGPDGWLRVDRIGTHSKSRKSFSGTGTDGKRYQIGQVTTRDTIETVDNPGNAPALAEYVEPAPSPVIKKPHNFRKGDFVHLPQGSGYVQDDYILKEDIDGKPGYKVPLSDDRYGKVNLRTVVVRPGTTSSIEEVTAPTEPNQPLTVAMPIPDALSPQQRRKAEKMIAPNIKRVESEWEGFTQYEGANGRNFWHEEGTDNYWDENDVIFSEPFSANALQRLNGLSAPAGIETSAPEQPVATPDVLKKLKSKYDGWDRYKGPDGKVYDVGQSEDDGRYYATGRGGWDDIVADGATRDEAVSKLAGVLAPKDAPTAIAPNTPVEAPSVAEVTDRLSRQQRNNAQRREELSARQKLEAIANGTSPGDRAGALARATSPASDGKAGRAAQMLGEEADYQLDQGLHKFAHTDVMNVARGLREGAITTPEAVRGLQQLAKGHDSEGRVREYAFLMSMADRIEKMDTRSASEIQKEARLRSESRRANVANEVQSNPNTQTAQVAETRANADLTPDDVAINEFHDVYTRLVNGDNRSGRWASMRMFREDPAIAKYSRERQDQILKAWARADGVHFAPEDNQKILTQADWDAALRSGGQSKHLISLDSLYKGPPAVSSPQARTTQPESVFNPSSPTPNAPSISRNASGLTKKAKDRIAALNLDGESDGTQARGKLRPPQNIKDRDMALRYGEEFYDGAQERATENYNNGMTEAAAWRAVLRPAEERIRAARQYSMQQEGTRDGYGRYSIRENDTYTEVASVSGRAGGNSTTAANRARAEMSRRNRESAIAAAMQWDKDADAIRADNALQTDQYQGNSSTMLYDADYERLKESYLPLVESLASRKPGGVFTWSELDNTLTVSGRQAIERDRRTAVARMVGEGLIARIPNSDRMMVAANPRQNATPDFPRNEIGAVNNGEALDGMTVQERLTNLEPYSNPNSNSYVPRVDEALGNMRRAVSRGEEVDDVDLTALEADAGLRSSMDYTRKINARRESTESWEQYSQPQSAAVVTGDLVQNVSTNVPTSSGPTNTGQIIGSVPKTRRAKDLTETEARQLIREDFPRAMRMIGERYFGSEARRKLTTPQQKRTMKEAYEDMQEYASETPAVARMHIRVKYAGMSYPEARVMQVISRIIKEERDDY